MKFFIEFSRNGLNKNKDYILTIKNTLLERGHSLSRDLLAESNKEDLQHRGLPSEVFTQISKAIANSQAIIIEGSEISLSIGYVLTESISLGKPTLFLRQKKADLAKSRFIDTIKSKLIMNEIYNDEADLLKILDKFLDKNQYIKTRFNLVLPNDLDSYITEKSRSKNISKTEYIIDLIRDDFKNQD